MSLMLQSRLFSSDAFSVDVLDCQGKLFFRAADVTRGLGYGNSSQAVKKNVRAKYVVTRDALDRIQQGISAGDRGVSLLETPLVDDSSLYISEPGLYELTLKSRKPEAEVFQEWVVEEVLPQLRAAGQHNARSRTKLQLQLTNEADLHYKVVDFIRTFHPEALLVAGLGENQDTDTKRIDSWRKGYTKGQVDLILLNRSARWAGLALEFKTPAGKGPVMPEQRRFMEELAKAGLRVLLSNNYDEICNEIRDYFRTARALCQVCGKWVRASALEAHMEAHSAEGDGHPVQGAAAEPSAAALLDLAQAADADDSSQPVSTGRALL